MGASFAGQEVMWFMNQAFRLAVLRIFAGFSPGSVVWKR